jgi:hypothetical protein
MILGLDASTTTSGVSITIDGNILHYGWIDLKKVEGNRLKVKTIIDFIKSHPNLDSIKKINLESAISGFGFGGTSQQTILKLIRFNGILEYVLEETFPHIKISLVGATTARKKVFGKSRVKGIPPKKYVRMQLEAMYDLSKYLIKNSHGNEDKRNEDALDALVLSLYG